MHCDGNPRMHVTSKYVERMIVVGPPILRSNVALCQQKGLAFASNWSSNYRQSRASQGALRPCPAGFIAEVGLRWCGGDCRKPNGGSQMSKSAKNRSTANLSAISAATQSHPTAAKPKTKKANSGSKQSRLLTMFCLPPNAIFCSTGGQVASGTGAHAVVGVCVS